MDTTTKRLHISGLTPNISSNDLKNRFSSFGTVTALDGHGLLDGNGDPRRFAYVTLEGSKTKVAKCLNVLSGTTWKGAKLRIGEARPDYRERIAQERADSDDARPTKRRKLSRGVQGVHAAETSLVTVENFHLRSGGWIKTPMGRLVRPMRMRPAHPLPKPSPSHSSTASSTRKVKGEGKEKGGKKRPGELTRARRKLINPLEYGSTYLKGVLLEGDSRILQDGQAVERIEEKVSKDAEIMIESQSPNSVIPSTTTTSFPSTFGASDPIPSFNSLIGGVPSTIPSTAVQLPSSPSQSSPSNAKLPFDDFTLEAKRNLTLLRNIYDREDAVVDWGGQESLSDVDTDEQAFTRPHVTEVPDNDYEIVPRNTTQQQTRGCTGRLNEMDVEEEGNGMGNERPGAEERAAASSAQTQATNLKALFTPRGEVAGFSLLADLDLELDLELDDSLNIIPAAPLIVEHDPGSPFYPSGPTPPSTSTSSTSNHPPFDPHRTLFFPLPLHSDPSSSSLNSAPKKHNQKTQDIYSALDARHWLGAPPFVRSEDEDTIRENWEKKRAELTREWKLRWRGARKRGLRALE